MLRPEAGEPEKVAFRTEPQLPQDMVERAIEKGIPLPVVRCGHGVRLWPQGAAVAGAARDSPCADGQEQREVVGLDEGRSEAT